MNATLHNIAPKTVYFIKPIGMDGPVKIGGSKLPTKRRDELEVWSPFPLEIVAELPGNLLVERQFHALFEHLHENREWFTAAPELIAVIEQIKAGTFDVASLPEPRGLRPMGRRTAAFTRQLSLSQRVTHTERRTGYKCPVSTWNMIRDNDTARIAAVEAYLSDPITHGIRSRDTEAA